MTKAMRARASKALHMAIIAVLLIPAQALVALPAAAVQPTMVTFCHIPEGNTGNPQELTLPADQATDGHLSQHEYDYLGNCAYPSADELVVTEIMQNPDEVSDANGEWFEIYNASSADINMSGMVISDGSESFTVSGAVIGSNEYFVFGRKSDMGVNGGVPVDYEYSGFQLTNGADAIILTMVGEEIDRVEYDGGPNFPNPTGASMILSDISIDNNIGSNWCVSTSSYGEGDLGTPGAANDSCAEVGGPEVKPSISGCKYLDEDGDGFLSGSEEKLQGWSIILKLDGEVIDSAVTGSDGCYEFSEVEPGNYIVEEETQDNFVQTYPVSGSYSFEAAYNQDIENIDFGNTLEIPAYSCENPIILDFDTDALGNPILFGQFIDDEYAAWGVNIHGHNYSDDTTDVITFDSNNPSGGTLGDKDDVDLGTPNMMFGGPGDSETGDGSEASNNIRLNNLLIIPDNIFDNNSDGYVDDPNDEPSGGSIRFVFDMPVTFESVRYVDLDYSTGEVAGYADIAAANQVFSISVPKSTGNSVQTINTDNSEEIRYLKLRGRDSYAVDTVVVCPVPQEIETYCGDGIVQSPNDDGIYEECDGGNDCTNDCTLIADVPVCEAGVNLIANGGFELPVVTHSAKWNIYPGSDVGWKIEWLSSDASYNGYPKPEEPKLELHNRLWTPKEGNQYAELDSDWDGPGGSLNNEPASVTIYQDIATIPGESYFLKYAFSPRPNLGVADNSLELKIDNTPIQTHLGTGGSNTNWTEFSYEFTATSTVTRVQFSDTGAQNSLGTFLDDVKMECQPQEIKTYCGDGIVQSPNDDGIYEECDGGNDCTNDCTLIVDDGPVCGNGELEEGEECENDSQCESGFVCSECGCVEDTSTSICGVKFYDHNENADQDQGDENLSGWEIELYEKLSCAEGDEWADEVVSFEQGTRQNGSAVLAERSDPTKALGPAQYNDTLNFVSLGFGGEIVLKFNNLIENLAGDDIEVVETSYGSPNCSGYPEKMQIYASQTGNEDSWVLLGSACLDSTFDLGVLGWAQYVKIVDKTFTNDFLSDADGYDIDGVRAISCRNVSVDPVATEETTENGYCFEDLENGWYHVREVMQGGWTNTTDIGYQVEVTDESRRHTVDFGNVPIGGTPEGSICGYKFEDMNGDGEWQTESESGIPEWRIYARQEDAAPRTTLTNSEGRYCFTSLEDGLWIVSEEEQDGWVASTPTTTEVRLVGGAGTILNNFGNYRPASISGYKFHDIDKNGEWDDGDEGLPGWAIRLFSDGNTEPIDEATTDEGGYYEFVGISPGSYAVSEVLQSEWIQSYPINNAHEITVVSGGTYENYNFLNYLESQEEQECTPQEVRGCDTGEYGICSSGTQACGEDGFWGECVQAQEPVDEICDDGLDNDCDGETDEGCTEIIETTTTSGGGGGGGGGIIQGLQIHTEKAKISDIPGTISVVVTWFTNKPASSRVVYDTVSHSLLDTPPNYGYLFSTPLINEDAKVTFHTVIISGLDVNTTYYFRPISAASPEVWGDEVSITTTVTSDGEDENGDGDSVGGGGEEDQTDNTDGGTTSGGSGSSGAAIGGAPQGGSPDSDSEEGQVLGTEFEETEATGGNGATSTGEEGVSEEDDGAIQEDADEDAEDGAGGRFQQFLWLLVILIIIWLFFSWYNKKDEDDDSPGGEGGKTDAKESPKPSGGSSKKDVLDSM